MTALTRRASARTGVAALAALSGITLAACSSPYGSSTVVPPAATTTTVEGASTPAQTKAADLRGSITYLLVEHAYLLGRVTAADAGHGASAPTPAAPTTTAAPATTAPPAPSGAAGPTTTAAGGAPTTTVAALPAAPAAAAPSDDAHTALAANTKDLADALGTAFGGDFGSSFSQAWSQRIGGFEAYARAKAASDDAAKMAAQASVAAASTAVATLFHANDEYLAVTTLNSTGIGDELTADDTLVFTMIDSQAANQAAQWTNLVAFAEGMPHTAEIMAAGIAKLHPKTYPGTATGTAANLRASLTMLLVEHVELGAIVEQALATGAPAGPQAAAWDNNGKQLHNAVASVYADASATDFSALWASQVSALKQYATAQGAGDTAKASSAKAALGTFASAFGGFVAKATAGRVSADTASSAIGQHDAAMTAIADAAASGGSTSSSLSRAAASQIPGLAGTLAEAISEQFPTTYLP